MLRHIEHQNHKMTNVFVNLSMYMHSDKFVCLFTFFIRPSLIGLSLIGSSLF